VGGVERKEDRELMNVWPRLLLVFDLWNLLAYEVFQLVIPFTPLVIIYLHE